MQGGNHALLELSSAKASFKKGENIPILPTITSLHNMPKSKNLRMPEARHNKQYNNNYGKRLRKYSVPYIFNTIENLDLTKL